MSSTTPPSPLEPLPAWARRLSEKYYSRTLAMFVLHGNVHDLVPWRRGDRTDYVPLSKFLNEGLFGRRDLVLSYDRGGGITFANSDVQADFQRALVGYDSFHGTKYSQGLPRNPDAVLTLIESYLRLRVMDGKKIALMLDFADSIVPASDSASMGSEDRNCLVMLKRWAQNQHFLRADVTVCLIAESLSAVNSGLVQNPGVSAIEIPLPDEAERIEFVKWQMALTPLPEGSEVTAETLAKLGAGLKRVQLQNLISHASENRQPLTLAFLTRLKKELIEAESGGLLEFVQSRFDLSMVAGLEQAKKKLQDAATALRVGRFDVLPMGYVISGPVGTGKTFLTTCFAGEVGIPAVMLKNFRSMWQGVTEANLERVLTLLKAMSPIAVVVDEADAQLGDRSSSGDSGVGNRVFAQIAQFMGNTELRGKVIWFLLTCRPDLLPVDLKRQGRAEEHIALFYPRSDAERLAMLRAMQRKTGTRVASEEAEQFFLANAGMLSGADTEAVLVRARMKSALEGDAAVDVEDLKAAIADFIPPSYPDEIELQNLVAVLECTSRSLLPEEYRTMDRGEIQRRVAELLALAR
ncbi:ATP-binding protein [Paludibaculum fermentans]|uniref:ATP-binding protein n=1 Tax=Paludibaculum fermentans TaxID=1473598 RepID=A0A7S7NVV4_PALFE|nr:AAA family ATPase [Paludibaculum fermentans]QOY90747.1 ATP-binding protein [Paludibaculum fermentans]